MNKNLSKDEIDQYIIQIVKEKKPDNIEQLVKLMQNKFSLSAQEILDRVLYLEEKEKLQLKPHQITTPKKLTAYLGSSQTYWFWATIMLAVITTVIVFIVPENAYPLVYARYILGSIFILWLPGYTLTKALFPTKEIGQIERAALSIGMSLALVPITGLLLNYTPWGIRLTPVTLSLLALTLALATVALLRERQVETETP